MDQQAKSHRFVALKYRDFRLMWFGLLISNIGSQMQIVALNWHIYILTHSALALGMIGLSRFIPIVFFSLIAGSFADAHNRKKILFVTQTVMTIASLLLAAFTFSNTVTPFWIYLLTIVSSIGMAFDTPPRQALIPSLVDRKYLANAISLNTIMFQTSTVIGPALAGIFIAKYGVGTIYSLNAISFLAVIGALALIHTTGAFEGIPAPVSFSSVKEGLFFVKSKVILWSSMMLDFFSTFFSSATALLPIFAKEILVVGPQELGLLYSAQAIGAVITGFVLAHIGTIKKQGRLLLFGASAYGVATIVFGLSRNFWLSFIALLIVGAGDCISTIIRVTIRQLTTPDYIRGRMTAVNMIFIMGGPQLGEFEAGFVAALIGAPLSVVTGGIGTLLAVGIIAYTIPILRNYEYHEKEQHSI